MPHRDDSAQRANRAGHRTFQVNVEAWSSAPPGDVFELLADVTTWTSWSGFKEAYYEREGSPSPHGVGAVRRFRVGPLSSREAVLQFDPDRRLVYDYVGSMPFDEYRGEVTLTRHRGGTRINWRADFSARRPLSGPLLRRIMAKVLRTVANRLAVAAAETGLRRDRLDGPSCGVRRDASTE